MKLESLFTSIQNFTEKTNDTHILISFFCLNIILKFIWIDFKDISHDEPFTIFHANGSWSELLEMLSHEPNPPLFFILLHFWIKLFGISATSVRFLPLLFSSLTVIPLYKFGKLIQSRFIGLAAIIIFTFSSAHLASAHDARSYSLFVLLATMSSYFLFKILFKKQNNKSIYIALGLSYFLMIYSHHIGFIVGLVHLFIIATNFQLLNREKTIGLLISGVLTLLFYAHYIPYFLSSFIGTTSTGTVNPSPTSSALYNSIRFYMNEPLFAVMSIIGFAGFSFKVFTQRRASEISLLILFCFLFFGMYLLSDLVVLFVNRYILFISPIYFIIVPIGWTSLSKNKLIPVIALSTIALGMVSSADYRTDNKRYVKKIVDLIKEEETGNSAIIMCPKWTNHRFAYYYDQNIFRDHANFEIKLEQKNVFSINSIEEFEKLEIDKFNKIIFLDGWAEVVDPEMKILATLNNSYQKTLESFEYKGYRIWSFKPKEE